ncbi:DUF7948 domain-containing protein [Sphingobacterium multivorum]|uniref:DUF7948 domain-containing protein n=1 Tax=Sphingobacterium multivorum TaxID=28454 RepID=UPI0028A6799C|nr:SBBP repeat-containing protein [Sphingobacterium multivorum]
MIFCFLSVLSKGFAKQGFIANQGQIKDQFLAPRPDILFKINSGKAITIFLSANGIHYQWGSDKAIFRMDVQLLGANKYPVVSTEEPMGYKEHYVGGKETVTVRQFGKVIYRDVYPHIDWVFYFNADGQLEHDFVVRPGGDASDIKIQYLGADKADLYQDGSLLAETSFGSVRENRPYAYEQVSGRTVRSAYRLDGNILSFSIANYSGTLIIDPVIDWATYIGGAEYEEVWDTKTGTDSMVYVVGATNSLTNIATTGAYLTTFAGGTNPYGSDAFLRKYTPQGECLWGTYVGGAGIDLGMSLAIDTSGNLYVAGRTNSPTGISTTGVHQEVKAGSNASYDAFIIKFDTAGQRLAGTYFGGTGAEGTEKVAIACDRYNTLYLVGNTQSAAGIATATTFQPVRPGGQDGFIAKFNPSLLQLWGSYFGTSSNDYINAVTTDTAGNVLVAGHTQSTTGLSTTGIGPGGTDGFVAKLDSAGSRIWSVYYGGPGYDKLSYLTADSTGNIYGVGATESTSGIATTGAHQSSTGGNVDLCLFKIDASGQLLWSTFYGGTENESVGGLLFRRGKLYLTGQTWSSNGITTADGITPVFNGSISEGMLASFSSSGQRLYGTYLGGDGDDNGSALAAYGEQLYIAGGTTSVNSLATTGADQGTFGGTMDGMLLRINMCDLPEITVAIMGNAEVCEHALQVYHIAPSASADSYIWLLPSGWTGSSSADSIVATVGSNSGELRVVPVNSCGTGDTLMLAVTVDPAPEPTISRSGNILSVGQSFSSYQWLKNGVPIPGANGPTYAATENATFRIRVTGTNGCDGLSNEIEISNLTGIKDLLSESGISVSPNPFASFIRLELPQNTQIRLLDISGKVVLEKTLKAGEHFIATTEIAKGAYILQVYTADGVYLGAVQLSKTHY